jgi:hypothetical protein
MLVSLVRARLLELALHLHHGRRSHVLLGEACEAIRALGEAAECGGGNG